MVRLVIWIVIGLLALSFFGISLQGLVDNPTNQDNVSFLSQMIRSGWDMILNAFTDIWQTLKNLFNVN